MARQNSGPFYLNTGISMFRRLACFYTVHTIVGLLPFKQSGLFSELCGTNCIYHYAGLFFSTDTSSFLLDASTENSRRIQSDLTSLVFFFLGNPSFRVGVGGGVTSVSLVLYLLLWPTMLLVIIHWFIAVNVIAIKYLLMHYWWYNSNISMI